MTSSQGSGSTASIEHLCRLAGVSRASFYRDWQERAPRVEDTALRDKLDAALKDILADGTYKTINAKYFPFSIY